MIEYKEENGKCYKRYVWEWSTTYPEWEEYTYCHYIPYSCLPHTEEDWKELFNFYKKSNLSKI